MVCVQALGVLLYTLLFGQAPFKAGKLAIMSGKYAEVNHDYPQPVVELLNHLLTR